MAFQSTIYGSTFPDTRELKELQMENLSPEDLGSNVKAFLRYAISNPGHKEFVVPSPFCRMYRSDNSKPRRAFSRIATATCRGKTIPTSFRHGSVCLPDSSALPLPLFCSSPLLHHVGSVHRKKLHGLSPRANYTDRATSACRRSDCQLVRIEGATWSA
jgi:hypothetical protein